MKFRKVEIQAFRAYDKVQDSTFDFEMPNGSPADFISLYAPNGFGKTSFYDAVEFGITKNINRFLKRHSINKDTAKSERNISTRAKQYILRNKFSDDKIDSFIKLYTSDSEDPLVTDIAKPSKVGGFDYKFNVNDTIKPEFQSVILSQEWIDAFLKEDTATNRFDTFIEHFGDKQMDDYYRKLTDLISFNKKRIDILKKQVIDLKSELDFEGDLKILEKVNNKLDALNAVGEKLTAIESSFTKKDELKLINKISERNSDLLHETNSIQAIIQFIDSVYSGNSKIESLEVYIENKVKLKAFVEREKEINRVMVSFQKRRELNKKLENIHAENERLQREKGTGESVKNEYQQYSKTCKEIELKNAEVKRLRTVATGFEKSIYDTKKAFEEAKIKANSHNKQITALESTLKNLPQIKLQIETSNRQLSNEQKDLSKTNILIDKNKKEHSELISKGKLLEAAMSKIPEGIYSSPLNRNITNFQNLSVTTKKLDTQLADAESNKNNIAKKFKSQQKFQLDIERFISKGAEIINQSQSGTCPLCSNEYSSFNELSLRVSNNKLLPSILSELIKERNENDNLIKELNKTIQRNRRSLMNLVKKEMQLNDKKLSTNSRLGSELKVSKDKLLFEIRLVNNQLKALNKEIGGLQNQNTIVRKLANLKKELPKLTSALELSEGRLTKLTMDLNINQSNHLRIVGEVEELKKNASYNKVEKHYKKVFPNKTISITLLQDKLAEISNQLNENLKEIKKSERELENLNKKLLEIDEKNFSSELGTLEKSKRGLNQINTAFEVAVFSILKLQIKELPEKSISKLLKDQKLINQKNLSQLELLVKEYKLLVALLNNVAPYLKYEKAKESQDKINKRIHFLTENIAKDLTAEKDRVSAYINEQINSFFYEDLINDLYKRIDPHPDYKNIKFVTDFNDDKPKLNVCVYQTNEEELIIPNLYFSTAQLNILSLSIFLAKALNAKDDKKVPLDCIFIDDPIQSMDSINILSTIDLLRSIVVNQKKQIILSTHDENFHALLRKKMPPGLFNSKFMELETFGKVKLENVQQIR